jgi:hypothetical protein
VDFWHGIRIAHKRAVSALGWICELVAAPRCRSAAIHRGRYYGEHHKIIGAIHAAYKNEAILGYAYDFNKTWRVQVDFQSGSENSSTIGFTWNIRRDFQVNPAIYVTNDSRHEVLGYVVFTYTFRLRDGKKKTAQFL